MTVCIHLIPLSQPCNSCGPLRERSNTFGHIPDEIQTLRSVVRTLEAEVARLTTQSEAVGRELEIAGVPTEWAEEGVAYSVKERVELLAEKVACLERIEAAAKAHIDSTNQFTLDALRAAIEGSKTT